MCGELVRAAGGCGDVGAAAYHELLYDGCGHQLAQVEGEQEGGADGAGMRRYRGIW